MATNYDDTITALQASIKTRLASGKLWETGSSDDKGNSATYIDPLKVVELLDILQNKADAGNGAGLRVDFDAP